MSGVGWGGSGGLKEGGRKEERKLVQEGDK